ncbi:MAG: class I SAM-dependent methyltransferase [Magnetococcales bacterium]|nr:class I SAM-dependent methyltransferase [Magnetococcales bacterium]
MNTTFVPHFSPNMEVQISNTERNALLTIQEIVRNSHPGYVYLEVGSYLGGTLYPHLADPACQQIYSVDLRPASQADERGRLFRYESSSTDRMRTILSQQLSTESMSKLTTFDADLADVSSDQIGRLCDLIFIDAEHTNRAAFRDFLNAYPYAKADVIIMFHDANLIFDALENVESWLISKKIKYDSFVIPDNLFVIVMGIFIELGTPIFSQLEFDKKTYFHVARQTLQDYHGVRALRLYASWCLIHGYRRQAARIHQYALRYTTLNRTNMLEWVGDTHHDKQVFDKIERFTVNKQAVSDSHGPIDRLRNRLAMVLLGWLERLLR